MNQNAMQKHAHVCKIMLKYAEACTSMQKHAQVCRSMHKYAEACTSIQKHAQDAKARPSMHKVL